MFWQKNVIIPPSLPPSLLHSLLSIILFDTKIFVEHRRVPLLNFLLLRDNTIDGKSWDSRPLLFLAFFDTRIFFKHRRGPLRIFYALWDNNFSQKNVIIPPRLPRSSIIFFKFQNFCGTQKDSPTKFFGTLSEYYFYGKSWHNLLKHKFFDTRT